MLLLLRTINESVSSDKPLRGRNILRRQTGDLKIYERNILVVQDEKRAVK